MNNKNIMSYSTISENTVNPILLPITLDDSQYIEGQQLILVIK